jgi:hypothetical protein
MADSPFLPFVIQHRRTCCFVRHLRTAKSGRQMFKWLAGYWPNYVARFASVDEARQYIADARIAGPWAILEQREGGRYA